MQIRRRRKPAVMLPEIQLPVFVRVEVDGYELFPGRERNGLKHKFEPGVTVIAGMNGVGKTTLLNVMLRLLVGPFNPEKATPFEVGAKSHSLVAWKPRNYFRARVSDDAAGATAFAEVEIGSHRLCVRRRLSDLSIVFLELDGQELESNEAEFERAVLHASNAATRYDFDFLVRYLVFFLEQRVPLFWNERGQIETFRILLCDAELASDFQKKQDDIQSKDSHFRNFRWQANKRRGKLDEQRAALAKDSKVHARILALQEQFRALKAKDEALLKGISDCSSERSELKSKLLVSKIELEQAHQEYEALQHRALTELFPDTAESARYIFSSLLSEKGCGVCGNRSGRGFDRVVTLLARGDCPVCESEPAEQERALEQPPVDRAVLDKASVAITRLHGAVRALERSEKASHERLQELLVERNANEVTWSDVRSELLRLNAQLPASPQELRQLEGLVQDDERQMAEKLAELERLYTDFEGLIARVDERVQAVSENVRTLFSHYAGSFLEERCQLGLARYKDDVGQERKFEYPCFNVYMTSATSPDRETARTEQEQVSESQREFIDLAFRMAMIAAVKSERSRAMLIIETPEASLDAYFVDQAGALLRQFGETQTSGALGNVIVVSSNVNRQNMISALLGFTEARSRWPSKTEVRKRVINMLHEAEGNAALRKRRSLYEEELERVTHGRIPAGEA